MIGAAPAGIGGGSGGIAGRGIAVTGGGVGGRKAGTDAGVGLETVGRGTSAGTDGTDGAVAIGSGAASAADSDACDARAKLRGTVNGSGAGGTAAIGLTGVGAIGAIGARGVDAATAALGTMGVAPATGAAMEITPPHTEHRARTPTVGTFDGSIRKTDRQSGHDTFTSPPPRWPRRASAPMTHHLRPACHHAGRS